MSSSFADSVANGVRSAANAASSFAAAAGEYAPGLKDVAVRGTQAVIDGVNHVGELLTQQGVSAPVITQKSRDAAVEVADSVGAALTKSAVAIAGVAAEAAQAVARNSDEVGAAVSGIANGAAEVATGVYSSAAVTDRDLQKVSSELQTLADRFPERFADWRAAARAKVPQLGKREAVAEVLTIGGFSLSALALAEAVPERVQRAYELAYPGDSQLMRLSEKIASLDSAQALTGLRSAVQGKLVEVEYMNWLNDGNLPEGHIAELAASANNPGWDIQVVDSDGVVLQLLNPKDTPELSYVLEGINKYADVDFVTWPSVHAELALRGYAEQASALPLDQLDIQASVDSAFEALDVSDVLAGGLFGIAAAALFAFSRQGASSIERAHGFGEQLGRSKVAAAAGIGATSLTGVGAVGVAAIVGTRLLGQWGTVKRRKLDALIALRDAMNDATERRMAETFRLSMTPTELLPVA
jgi:hypothetical protein